MSTEVELKPCPLKVMQTKFGNDNGNCLTACLASLTGIPIEKLPDLYSHSGIEWWDTLYAWCVENNYGLMLIKEGEQNRMLVLNQYGIGVAKLKNIEVRHAVILKYTLNAKGNKWYWDAEVWHDPNPTKYEIEKIEEHIFINNWNTRPQPSETKGVRIKRVHQLLSDCLLPFILPQCADIQESFRKIAETIDEAYAKSSPALMPLDEEGFMRLAPPHREKWTLEEITDFCVKFGSPAKRVPSEMDLAHYIGTAIYGKYWNNYVDHQIDSFKAAKSIRNLLTQEEGKT